MADSSQIQIQSFLLSDRGVEVSYIEERHVTDRGIRVQTVQINARGFEPAIQEVIDAIAELVEQYDIGERKPPPTVPSRKAGLARE
jgi:hypothetical protein